MYAALYAEDVESEFCLLVVMRYVAVCMPEAGDWAQFSDVRNFYCRLLMLKLREASTAMD